jgi:RNA polymerase sigma-70 factor, ECF subfamily
MQVPTGLFASAVTTATLRRSPMEMSGEAATLDDRRGRFNELIVPEVDFLARVSRSMSRSAAEAEDLAQDVLLRAFRSIDSFDGSYPRAWLFRIARNAAINRDQRKRDILLDEGEDFERRVGEGGTPGWSDPAEQVVAPLYDEVLERALDDLPPAFRVVVDLVDVEGMRYQEAADLLGVPVGTIMSRLHRARGRLRAAVAGSPLDRSARHVAVGADDVDGEAAG